MVTARGMSPSSLGNHPMGDLGGSIPPVSPVGPRGGQGPIAGVLDTLSRARRVPPDPQDSRAGCRAGVRGHCRLQRHVGMGGGQLLVRGHGVPRRGVPEGVRGCTAQTGAERLGRGSRHGRDGFRSSEHPPLARATTSQTASEALASRSKTPRGLSSVKVVAVSFPGSSAGGTRGM